MPERLIFLTLGFISTLAQTILIRALMNRLGGSELAVGLAISGWLLLSGIVSLASGRLIDRFFHKRSLLTLLTAALPLAPTLGLLLLIKTPQLLGIMNGAIPSPLEFTLCAWLVTLPSAMLLGVSFNLCVAVSRDNFGVSLKNVYLYQALGAAAGGFITAWLLLEIVSSVGMSWLILAVCAGAAQLSVIAVEQKKAAAAAGVLILLATDAMLLLALNGAWRLPAGVDPAQISLVRENRFGVLSLMESGSEAVVFSGSRSISDNRRPESDEELVLLAHCLNPKAHSAAWLGGPLAEPYNLSQEYAFWNRYVYVNPDSDFVELESRRLTNSSQSTSPLKIEYQDLRGYIREGSERFDMLIVNGGDPDTLATNRLFTAEFFRQAASRLTDRGVLIIFALEPGNYIPEAEGEFLASVAGSLRGSFKYMTLLPFSRYTFAASNSPEIKQYAGTIDVELQMITPIPKYFTHEVVKDRLSNSRMEMLSKALQKAVENKIAVNSDALPTALLQKSLLDASRFGSGVTILSSWKENGSAWIYALAGLLIVLSLALSFIMRKGIISPLAAIAFSGTAGIMIEITLMNSYQSRYGELYQMLGAMLAAYMSGLGAGAYAAHRLNEIKPHWNAKALFISLLILCTLHALAALDLHYGFGQSSSGSTGLLFIAMLFVVAGLSGAVFMFASTLVHSGGEKAFAFKAGLLAGADHLLPALAAATLSILVLPIIGATYTLGLAAAFCLSAAIANFRK